VLARAESLPLRGACADIVCSAQAWHWVDVDRAAPEVLRVLRPGGALALWWNDVAADGVPWHEDQQERLEAISPGYARDYREPPQAEEMMPTFSSIEFFRTRWERTLPIDDYIVSLSSRSYVAAIGERLGEFLDAERASLAEAFPDGVVVEPFETRLYVGRS
jgi:SAM-dependent methyltransferase